MGMFDWVNFKASCPNCGTEVTGWQTKSTGCSMATVTPAEAGNWYSSCSKCGLWIEYNAEYPQERFFATRSVKLRNHENNRESVMIVEKKKSEWGEE